MIEGLKPYSKYKEVGLPWLDAVPHHWDMAPNRALMRDQKQVVGERASDYTLLSLTLRGVIARDMVNPKGKFPAQFNTYKIVRENDFVFCLFDIDETPRGVGLSSRRGMITGAYDVFSPTQRINPRYLYHYYLFVDQGKLMKPFYTGLRKTIQRSVFAGLKAPLPPPDEQAAIVRFLDHANRKIDGFIRAKRKLIGLLNEQKQAIIHRAVTRGLDPNAKLKPSGIPWLGEIPKHWEVRPLKYVCRRIQNGATPPSDSPHYFQNGTIPWFGPTSISSSIRVGAPAKHLAADAVSDGKARLIKSPALLVVVIGTVGKMALLTMDGTTNQQITAFELRSELVVPELLTLQLKLAEPWLNAAASSSTIPILDSGLLKRTATAEPPLEEQKGILEMVLRQSAPYDTAIARTEREIALMQEYRTRLTADIVTGKLDVREAAAKLPEEKAEEIVEADLSEDETELEEAE